MAKWSAVPARPPRTSLSHDRWAKQFSGIVDQAPTLIGAAHVFFEWRMTPIRVPWAEPLVEIGGLGIHLRFSRPADNNVAEQRHLASGMEHVVRSLPANRRVNPVPRRRSHEDIEASTAVVLLLKRRRLDFDVAEGSDPVASECGHVCPRLDGSH